VDFQHDLRQRRPARGDRHAGDRDRGARASDTQKTQATTQVAASATYGGGGGGAADWISFLTLVGLSARRCLRACSRLEHGPQLGFALELGPVLSVEFHEFGGDAQRFGL
jgi:hypothetical protein